MCELADLRIVRRRAMQAAAMLRRTGNCPRPVGTEWLGSLTRVFRSRAILAG
ncbi:hypothetical protein [Streptomyces sp. NPDC051219]|uniref:hypothetical protein n=1 Tax=Streptomyces sp. NPDC051219 TaxID=3155283 RepID=UPI0034428BD4